MTENDLSPPEIEEPPTINHIWAAAMTHSERLELPEHRFDIDAEREAWFVPTVSIWSAERARLLCEEYGIERVYDLGAGDCRFALWMEREGYEVIAYEINETLARSVRERFHLGNLEIRCRDYYDDYPNLIGPESAVIAFGGTNELPHVPEEGLAIEGYSEIGRTAHYNGEVIAVW